ncbi:hypothetical protein HNP73_000274 [Amaricoccus macauensis]|uniref:Uncharacterized protein n=1 Tax=Amaricoccus macauensis TaxID=57001 RepID=A0A840SLK9_9RHOB|nr:hypothetical protein [Amaricoccus macauensis]MBB5220353.1 hypothetical protein [Amaricoccus macauensis]
MINILPAGTNERDRLVCGGCSFGFSHCGGSCDFATICTYSGCRECSGAFTCLGASACGGCTLNVTCFPNTCGALTCGCTESASVLFGGGGGRAFTPEALAALKLQLREALREVDRAEQVVAEQMKPHSVEEVEELEKKLRDALEELSARKEQLRGREGGSES